MGHEAVASKKVVLLFGSLPDKGSEVETIQVSPVGLDGVLRIGSATLHGETASENVYENPPVHPPRREHTAVHGRALQGQLVRDGLLTRRASRPWSSTASGRTASSPGTTPRRPREPWL